MVAREVSSLQKWYAVRRGRNVGIFSTWEQAREQIKGLDWAEMKTFERTSMVDGAVDRGLLSAKIWLRSGQNEECAKHAPQTAPIVRELNAVPFHKLPEKVPDQVSCEQDELVVNPSCFALKANVSPLLASAYTFGMYHAVRLNSADSATNCYRQVARKLDEQRKRGCEDVIRLKSIESLKKFDGIKLGGKKRRVDCQENILPSSDSDDSMRTTMASSPTELTTKSRKSDLINFSRKVQFVF
ncbi:ribonuclease H1 [Guillardia theta CCMP2712]|uniref:Ribonuclease H1 n=1 Tax=Guillardia theta (strain CCMP2712) TaxID=905079 RepID=L1K0B6_GUITC|nr:ribonuclease H1 [Guillardia theta CCMP2712]EKX53793.1 ribonuclease H1 [Guillardia theta CCMP2712]|eukprot:XP_005840773.1 ribonuclease H1 [Guillardia theta CCMP2712]